MEGTYPIDCFGQFYVWLTFSTIHFCHSLTPISEIASERVGENDLDGDRLHKYIVVGLLLRWVGIREKYIRLKTLFDFLQSGWSGFCTCTGKGEKLSNSQVCCLAQLCLTAA